MQMLTAKHARTLLLPPITDYPSPITNSPMQRSSPPIPETSTTLTSALKEWAIAVQALAEGETILLLRKGGIREQGGSFQVAQSRVWLYPTYEHQKPHLLKPGYASQVTTVESGWHPEQVTIQAWADITDIAQVSEAEVLEALLPFHIWNEQFVTERFNWKPKVPLYLLLLRVYRLPQPQMVFYHSSYGGCKSWIDLQTELPLAQAAPVLTDADYLRQVEAIQQVLGTKSPR